MHAQDILRYGHLTVVSTVEGFPREHFDVPGAVGYWSAKDLIAHLASYELALVELMQSILDPCPTPLLDQLKADGQAFNDQQVDVIRKGRTIDQVYDEYASAYENAAALVTKIPEGAWRQTGMLAWYGAEYDLEDYVVYTYYGHKREHCGQIQAFRNHL